MSSSISKIRSTAFQRQQGLCIYCQRPMWQSHLRVFAAANGLTKFQASQRRCTAEHLQARCDGGSSQQANIAAACAYCNQQRHQLKQAPTPDAYKTYVQQQLLAGTWAT
ncbi:hypothetical protein D3C81_353560 [compost metagenome]